MVCPGERKSGSNKPRTFAWRQDSYRDGNAEVYVMNADGSGQTRLTDDPGLDLEPAWSP